MLNIWADAYLRFAADCERYGWVWWIGPPSGCLVCIADEPTAEEE